MFHLVIQRASSQQAQQNSHQHYLSSCFGFGEMPSSGNQKHVSKHLMFTSLPEVVNIAVGCSLTPTVHQPSLRGVWRAAGMNGELVEIWKEEAII